MSGMALGQSPDAGWEKALDSLKDHIVALRDPARGRELRFDATGVREKGKPGAWATDAYVRVVAVEVKSDRVVIRGKRREAGVVQEQAGAVQESIVQPGAPAVVPMSVDRSDVKIEIATAPDRAGLAAALHQIFLSSQERVEVSNVRRCWRDPAASAGPPANSQEGRAIYRVGGGITAPRPVKAPDPAYSAEAQIRDVNGAVILWAVISAEGKPAEICVVQPLGYGLDENAIEAVRQWRFEPARKEGVPVPVQINIEINFRLY
jgi:TonB family protein